MITIGNKTDWLYILIVVIFFGFASAGILLLRDVYLVEDMTALGSFVPENPFHRPVAFPTEINQNFLVQVNECFFPVAAIYGYTLRITSGYRSLEEQDQLYEQGRTINGHIVTEAPAGKSIHNFGFAIDIVDRWHEYRIKWERLVKIAEYCGLESGEDGDIAHFEYRGGYSIADFLYGRRPVPLTLPCPLMDERVRAGRPLTLKDLKNCGAPVF